MSASETDSEIFEVDYILDQRKRGRTVEYLIRWKGYGDEEDSWEPLKNIKDAKEALDRFKKEGKPTVATPGKRQSQTKTKTTLTKGEGDSTTTTTKTTRTTIITSGSLGVDSSPESSPMLSRRLRHLQDLQDETKQKLHSIRGQPPQKRSAAGKKWSLNPCSWMNCSGMKGGVGSCLRITRHDIPILILITCMLIIAGTFVYEHQMKA